MKSIGIIRKVCSLINRSCFLTLYYSLIFPYISYCNIIWASTHSSYLQKITLLQKRFLRLATFSNRLEPSAPLFKKLNILSVSEVNSLQTCIFMYKCLYEKQNLPNVFNNFFSTNSDIHSYVTRQSNDLHIPYCRTTLSQFTIRYRGPTLWNAINPVLKKSPSLSLFKTNYKKILITNK